MMKKEDCRLQGCQVMDTGKEVSSNVSAVLLCQCIFELVSAAANISSEQGENNS